MRALMLKSPSTGSIQIANNLNDADSSLETTLQARTSYGQCVLNQIGFSGLTGLLSGGLDKLLTRGLWKEAALVILKAVGLNAVKGGVVGPVASLAAAAALCAVPAIKGQLCGTSAFPGKTPSSLSPFRSSSVCSSSLS